MSANYHLLFGDSAVAGLGSALHQSSVTEVIYGRRSFVLERRGPHENNFVLKTLPACPPISRHYLVLLPKSASLFLRSMQRPPLPRGHPNAPFQILKSGIYHECRCKKRYMVGYVDNSLIGQFHLQIFGAFQTFFHSPTWSTYPIMTEAYPNSHSRIQFPFSSETSGDFRSCR